MFCTSSSCTSIHMSVLVLAECAIPCSVRVITCSVLVLAVCVFMCSVLVLAVRVLTVFTCSEPVNAHVGTCVFHLQVCLGKEVDENCDVFCR